MEKNEKLFAGQIVSFVCPDSFRHNTDVRNFILIKDVTNHNMFSLMYFNNKCTCKDFEIKFRDILKDKDGPITLQKIEDYLVNLFPSDTEFFNAFDPSTLSLGNKL